jgi:Tfp pilus assembly protein PilE
MKRTQQGMTLIGFILVLAVVGVFIYMGMKLIPMYSEYYSVKQALEGMSKEAGMADKNPAQVRDLFFRRLYTSYAENVKPENVKLVRNEAGWTMTVDYEVRRPLVANIDVVGHFTAEKDFRRGGD